MIHRTNRRMQLCCALIIALLVFIWGNSLMPGSVSGAFSNWVKDVLRNLLPFLFNKTSQNAGGSLIRKLAHFTEFAALGASFCWLYAMLLKEKALQTTYAAASGILVACIDETIQRFVPDRHGCLPDVGIDTAGVITGILLFTAVYLICEKHYHYLEETK